MTEGHKTTTKLQSDTICTHKSGYSPIIHPILKTIKSSTLLSAFSCSHTVKRDIYSPGMEVPSATNTTAVTVSRSPTVQPKCDAKSPMMAVRSPMALMDTKKQAQPFQYSVGGTQANRTFQKTVRKCMT